MARKRYEGSLLRELSQATGIHENNIRKRLDRGMKAEQISAAPFRIRDLSDVIYLEGAPITRAELATRSGRSVAGVAALLGKGLSPEQIIATPKWRKLDHTLDGRPCTAADIAHTAGLCQNTVTKLLNGGLSPDDIVVKARRGLVGKCRAPKLVSVFGIEMTVREIAAAFGLTESTVKCRLNRGLSPENVEFHRVRRGGDHRARTD